MRYLLLFCLLAAASVTRAQYYYKDIIGTRETAEGMKAYLANKVRSVRIMSYDADGTRTEDMDVQQQLDLQERRLTTTMRSGKEEAPSVLMSWLNEQGAVTRTVDSGAALLTVTEYSYAPNGALQRISTTSTDSSKHSAETEVHIWEYSNGQVQRMLRIKNGNDTTFVQFKLDNNGNVAEEQSVRKGKASESVYYYYDSQNRLTDIVRYNTKAKRLLPEYMFEYGANNRVIQRITVPANSSRYTIWRYQYDNRGLKVKEVVYDRSKTLNGKIEYQYGTIDN